MNKIFPLIAFSVLLFVPINFENAFAVIFGGIDFPNGVSSFADSVITYNNLFGPGPAPTSVNYLNPVQSLGPPDYVDPTGSVSLGRGGLLEVAFDDNVLTNSGNPTLDLHIFEIGPDVEDTFVSIRPTAATAALLGPAFDTGVTGYPATIGDGFYEIGKVFGSTDSIDIDAIFPPAPPGTYAFDAVQLIDDPNEGDDGGATVGADIDAVGAITSMAPPPENIIGGKIIQINTTSLLLSYTQTFSWMIPILLSGIGIGLFAVSRRSD